MGAYRSRSVINARSAMWEHTRVCSAVAMDFVKSVLDSPDTNGIRPILVTLVATFSVTLITFVVLALQKRKRLPPGPFPWPVVGNLPSLVGVLPHHNLRSLANKYGGLVYLQLGSVPTILVSTVEVSKELFQTRDIVFLDRPNTMAFDVITENKNVVLASGRYWREARKLVTNALLTSRRLETYKAGREEEIRMMMKVLCEEAKLGRAIDLKSWLFGITSNNITRMLMNKRYFGEGDRIKKDKEDFDLMLARSMELSAAFIISDYIPYLAFVTKLQGWQKTLEDLRELTSSISDRMFEIERHRQQAREKRADEGVPDMVDVLLRTPLDNGKILPDKNISLILMDMIVAGSETSAVSIQWTMAELMRRPEILQRLQGELNTVIGPDRLPQESDIPNLPFLQALVKENFRIHPPLALNIPRESSKEFEFRGFKFPKKTRLLLNFHAIHRDPSVYESPDEFKPDRFLEYPEINHTAAFDSYELTPFSAGRRMCPAAELGNAMVCLVLAHLVHSFDWALPKGEEGVDMTEEFGLSVSLKNPLRLVPKTKPPASLY